MSNRKRIFGIIVLILGLLAISNGTKAQNVVCKGNTFIQQTTKGDSTATSYYYQDNMGKKYPIFLSSKGKRIVGLHLKRLTNNIANTFQKLPKK